MYLCTKFQSNIPILSKDIAWKPFFKAENFSKLKRAITTKIIGGFYPKSNGLHFMIIYQCIKFQSNTPIFSKDIARKSKVLRTGLDGTDERTDSGDTICSPPNPPPPPPIENGGDIKKSIQIPLTLVLLTPIYAVFENSVDPYQLASQEPTDLDLHCLSFSM